MYSKAHFCLTRSIFINGTLTLKELITTATDDNIFYYHFFIFQRKQVLTFHVNHLLFWMLMILYMYNTDDIILDIDNSVDSMHLKCAVVGMFVSFFLWWLRMYSFILTFPEYRFQIRHAITTHSAWIYIGTLSAGGSPVGPTIVRYRLKQNDSWVGTYFLTSIQKRKSAGSLFSIRSLLRITIRVVWMLAAILDNMMFFSMLVSPAARR